MSHSGSGIALLPIKPEYVQAILAGRKKVEFRKRRVAKPVGAIVIYATSPIKRVVAHFKISQIDEGKPEDLWRLYHLVGGIEKDAYSSYFRHAKIAVAIGISDLRKLEEPLKLKELIGTDIPPQSYSYLSRETLNTIPTLNEYFIQ